MVLTRIITNPDIMLGKPIIKGTRITVEIILRKISEGATVKNILEIYPTITRIDVNEVMLYAANIIANEEIIEA